MNPLPVFIDTDDFGVGRKPRTWIWDRFLTPRKLSVFTSTAKDGKTTLISQVVAAMEHGGEVAGSTVAKGRVVVATEEDDDDWEERKELLKIGRHVKWCFHPYCENVTWDDWNLFVMSLEQYPADLYLIDPLAHFLPDYAENHTATLRKVTEPLRQLAKQMNAAVLPLHHPSERGKGNFNFRGGGALKGFVDILMELKRLPDSARLDRRRVLSSTGRYPPEIVRTIELNAEGTATRVLTDVPPSDSFEAGWTGLRIVLEDAHHRLSRKEILMNWPEDYDKPCLATVKNWLEKAMSDKLVERFGKGRCASPYRYALTGKKFLPFGMSREMPDIRELDRELYG
jgi:hypothetical protein